MRHLRKSIAIALYIVTAIIALLLISVDDFNGVGAIVIMAVGWAVALGNMALLRRSSEGWKA